MLSTDSRTTDNTPGRKTSGKLSLDSERYHHPTSLVSMHTPPNRINANGREAHFTFTNKEANFKSSSPPNRAMTSMMIHVPRRPTEGFTPARMANATAVGTAVRPVVMPASHSTRLFLTQRSVLWKVLSRQLNGTGHPQDLAQLYGSSSVRCSYREQESHDVQHRASVVAVPKTRGDTDVGNKTPPHL